MVQVPAFRAVEGFEVAALCSRRPDRVAAAGEKLGVADVSTDWESFVARDDLDVISVATPTALHRDQVLAAFAAGKHVLCEKPVALTDEDAAAMLDAAESSGRAHAVCFESRYSPEKYRLARMVADGALGRVFAARSTASVDFWHPSHTLQSEWMYSLAEGGGYLLGMAAHDIDYVFSLFGPPEAVCADARTTFPEKLRKDGSVLHADADDSATVLLRLHSGVHATVDASAMLLHRNGDYRFEAFGTAGTAAIEGSLYGATLRAGGVDDDGITEPELAVRVPAAGAQVGGSRRAAAPIRQLALLLEDWRPALEGAPAPGVPTLVDGLVVQRTITAARASSAGEGWVVL
jgi:predicted dehydrogenase